jgi:predicted nucleotidyltransferase
MTLDLPEEIREDPCLSPAAWNILLAYRGSIAHNMYVPDTDPDSIDDKDLIGICVPPLECYFGLQEFGSHGTREIKHGEWDVVVYEARKAVRLLMQGNPNMLSLLWLRPGHYLSVSPAGRTLLRARDLFVGRHVYRSFCGYAQGQLHKMARLSCEGYQGQKRRKLFEKYGFDTKNAAHTIRLLRMCVEFLQTGVMHVWRHDAEELLAIKRGQWTLHQVQAETERLFALADRAYSRSTLPEGPSRDAIESLCMEIVNTASAR